MFHFQSGQAPHNFEGLGARPRRTHPHPPSSFHMVSENTTLLKQLGCSSPPDVIYSGGRKAAKTTFHNCQNAQGLVYYDKSET